MKAIKIKAFLLQISKDKYYPYHSDFPLMFTEKAAAEAIRFSRDKIIPVEVTIKAVKRKDK